MTGLLVAVAVWPAVLYAALVLVIVAAIIVVSALLGERHR